MGVNKIFSKVNYPQNKHEIKIIIKEYDKYLNDIYENNEAISDWKSEYIFSFMLLMLVLSIIKFGNVSLYIKLLYIIPSLICLIYNLMIFRRIKKENLKDKKLLCKKNVINVFMFVILCFNATFTIQAIVFPKWSDKEYLISIGVLVICFFISIIINNIVAPKKFLKRFLYNSKRYRRINSTLVDSIGLILAIILVIILIVIVKITKSYSLLLFLCYIALVLFFQIAIYLMYIYKQYSFIQKYKKSIK